MNKKFVYQIDNNKKCETIFLFAHNNNNNNNKSSTSH
jgi:hypothetical protein